MSVDLTPEPPDIVALNPGIADELEITRAKRLREFKCPGQHKKIVVNSESRTLTCNECGYVIDAYDYVESWAIEGDRRMTALKDVETRTRVLLAEERVLVNRVKNMRIQLKRGRCPQSEEERREFDRMRWNPTHADTLAKLVRLEAEDKQG